MDIQPVSKSSSTTTTAPTTTTANSSASSSSSASSNVKSKDRVDLSGRNPSNKQELMATYSKIRAAQPESFKNSILNSVNGSTSTSSLLQDIQNIKAPTIEYGTKAAPTDTKTASAAEKSTAPAVTGKTVLTNTEKVSLSVEGGTVANPNTVTAGKGSANRNNSVAVKGSGNNVNISGTTPSGVRQQTFELTGGAGIKKNEVTVQGNSNSVNYTGVQQQNNKIAVSGDKNSVKVGSGVSNNNVSVKGSGVSVEFTADNLFTNNQSGWTMNVNASNVSISVKNGEASVSGETKNLKIAIDNKTKTITVGPATDPASLSAV